MSYGAPYLVWREGRPRWTPGPALRAKGAVGQDLKDERGEWLPLELAIEQARTLNANIGVVSETARRRVAANAPGFVYFMLAGNHVKIGHSHSPLRRAREMRTAIPGDVTSLAAVRGTKDDERAIHALLATDHRRGEWFAASASVMGLMRIIVTASSAHDAIQAFRDAKGRTKRSHL